MKILVIEDDKIIAENIKEYLEQHHCVVDLCHDGEQGFSYAHHRKYDVIILDINLPNKSGHEIVKGLAKLQNHTPIIITSARDYNEEIIDMLQTGADDYMIKPFSLKELRARVQAVTRRSFYQHHDNDISVGELTLHLDTKTATRGGKKIILTKKEFIILEFLMRNAGKVVSKTELLDHTSHLDDEHRSDVTRVYIQMLRKKIDYDFKTHLIKTVRGMGYMIEK